METRTNHFALGIHREQRSLIKATLSFHGARCVFSRVQFPNSLNVEVLIFGAGWGEEERERGLADLLSVCVLSPSSRQRKVCIFLRGLLSLGEEAAGCTMPPILTDSERLGGTDEMS